MELKDIILNALDQSLSSEAYLELLNNYAADGKTSGEQKEDLIYYTKLNAQRSRRIGKTTTLSSDLVDHVNSLPKQTWLLITETWCGDAASSVPVIAKLAEVNDQIALRIVLRDEQPELMDHFLTKGGKSIPKLIVLDDQLEVRGSWGPRPEELQAIYWSWREKEDREPYKEFQVKIQKWYNDDKSTSIQKELLALLKKAKKVD